MAFISPVTLWFVFHIFILILSTYEICHNTEEVRDRSENMSVTNNVSS